MKANKLRGKIAENGLNITRLADLIGVSKTTVTNWMKTGNIKSKHMRDLVSVLHLTPEETIAIFFDEE